MRHGFCRFRPIWLGFAVTLCTFVWTASAGFAQTNTVTGTKKLVTDGNALACVPPPISVVAWTDVAQHSTLSLCLDEILKRVRNGEAKPPPPNQSPTDVGDGWMLTVNGGLIDAVVAAAGPGLPLRRGVIRPPLSEAWVLHVALEVAGEEHLLLPPSQTSSGSIASGSATSGSATSGSASTSDAAAAAESAGRQRAEALLQALQETVSITEITLTEWKSGGVVRRFDCIRPGPAVVLGRNGTVSYGEELVAESGIPERAVAVNRRASILSFVCRSGFSEGRD